MINAVIKLTLVSLWCALPIIANAGGDSFHIKIHQIKTIAPHKHIIHFKKLDKIGGYGYSHFLDNCANITLTINYKYQESFYKKMILFLEILFNKNNHQENINSLNNEINFLKQNIDKTFITNDIEAFNYHADNPCQLYSKNLSINKENSIHGLYLQFFVR